MDDQIIDMVQRVTNPEAFWQRPEDEVSRALLAAEPLASLLGEQLLVLQRIERSLETLMTLGNRQAIALEVIEQLVDEIAGQRRDPNE